MTGGLEQPLPATKKMKRIGGPGTAMAAAVCDSISDQAAAAVNPKMGSRMGSGWLCMCSSCGGGSGGACCGCLEGRLRLALAMCVVDLLQRCLNWWYIARMPSDGDDAACAPGSSAPCAGVHQHWAHACVATRERQCRCTAATFPCEPQLGAYLRWRLSVNRLVAPTLRNAR